MKRGRGGGGGKEKLETAKRKGEEREGRPLLAGKVMMNVLILYKRNTNLLKYLQIHYFILVSYCKKNLEKNIIAVILVFRNIRLG